jgi:hypothetical protein
MSKLKLFILLLGSKPPGRHTEQHDVFFGVGSSLQQLLPDIKAFWPEAADKIHIDAWREVTTVDDYRVEIVDRSSGHENALKSAQKLFFVNLGGYLPGRFEEQHYILLTVKPDKTLAFNEAKQTLFFKHNHFDGAYSHIDDKYGIDVDDLYEIEDILSASQKEKYRIELIPSADLAEDEINLGYLKLSNL